MSSEAFVERVFRNLPPVGSAFSWTAWKHGGNPTKEGVGVLPGTADVEALAGCILDVDRYRGSIEFVDECRSIEDERFVPPGQVRFYQRVKLPMIGSVHHELVLTDHGERDGWRVLAWSMLGAETGALDPKVGARSAYNVGAWLLRPDAVGYALSSAPRKEDVGRLKYAAMTKGADAGAAKVLEGNIAGMKRWAARR